jgi:hypothetical protein
MNMKKTYYVLYVKVVKFLKENKNEKQDIFCIIHKNYDKLQEQVHKTLFLYAVYVAF